jgi:hypothetical protein
MPDRVGGVVLRKTLVSLASVAVASLILFAGAAHAAPGGSANDSGGDTLEQFVKKCKAVDAFKERSEGTNSAEGFRAGFDFGQCVGYISGVLEFHAVLRGIDPGAALFCVPSQGITISEVIKLITKYADEHPEDGSKSISGSLLGVLIEALPCQEAIQKKSDSDRSPTRL